MSNTVLWDHLSYYENVLLAQSQLARTPAHPVLRGNPRELFVDSFLRSHIPRNYHVGQGGIINAFSPAAPGQNDYRPQNDIVVYSGDLPIIHYSERNCDFLIEGVTATFEIKTKITDVDLLQACDASKAHKTLKRAPRKPVTGNCPENISTYLIAYDGPENMSTIAGWLSGIQHSLAATPAELLDVIVVLGKGIVWRRSAFAHISVFNEIKNGTWVYQDQQDGNLYQLFVHLMSQMSNLAGPPDINVYASQFQLRPYKVI